MNTVDVLLAVSRGDRPDYLKRCILSILNQTNAPNKIIMVIDGYLGEHLVSEISKFENDLSNLEVLRIKKNVGLASALNFGLGHSQSSLIARIDPDDWMEPERLESTLDYFNNSPQTWVLGSYIDIFDEDQNFIKTKKFLSRDRDIKRCMFIKNPIAHPSTSFVRERILSIGGYPPFRTSQDWALWATVKVHGGTFANYTVPLTNVTNGAALLKRRDLRYFKGEKKVLRYMLEISAIGRLGWLVSLFIRFLIRSLNDLIVRIQKFRRIS